MHVRLALIAAVGMIGCKDADELVPKTVDEDPSLPAIEIADTKLHAEAFGDPSAPLVIALHGGPGGDYESMLDLKALADEGYRVVFWDHRGAGLSRRHPADSFTFDQYLEDLRLVIEHYTVRADQPLVFVGHSWGAMYATWFIDTYGDYGGRVRGAVLSDPGAFTEVQLEAFLKRATGSIAVTSEQLGDLAWNDQFLSAEDQAELDWMDSLGAIRGLPSDHRDWDHLAPFWRLGAVVRMELLALAKRDGFDWTQHLGAFQHPVLFLRGGLETAWPMAAQEEMAGAYPSASIVTIEDAGHEMIWDRPDAYLAHVRDYFGAIGFAGGAR